MATIRKDIVSRDDDCNIQEIDKGIKNLWCWNWLERQVDGVYVRDSIRKLNKSGVAYCNICSKEILYGNRGFLCISKHLESKRHVTSLQWKAG